MIFLKILELIEEMTLNLDVDVVRMKCDMEALLHPPKTPNFQHYSHNLEINDRVLQENPRQEVTQ